MKKSFLILVLAVILVSFAVSAQTYGTSPNFYLTFEEGTGSTANESKAGIGVAWDNATLLSGAKFGASKGGNGTGSYSLSRNRLDKGITIPHSYDVKGDTEYSFAAWIKLNQSIVSTTFVLFAKGDGADSTLDYQWRVERLDTNGHLKLFTYGGSTIQDTGAVIPNNTWVYVGVVVNNQTGRAVFYQNGSVSSNQSFTATTNGNTQHLKIMCRDGVGADCDSGWGNGMIDNVYINQSAISSQGMLNLFNDGVMPESGAPDTPLYIKGYLAEGDSCAGWNTSTSTQCVTSETTPEIHFVTNKEAYCAISRFNHNYTTMGSSRNCTDTEGLTEHVCYLTADDELYYEDSLAYIACKDSNGNENTTSTSGPLALRITGLEAYSDTFIGLGVQNALVSGYTNYTEQQIYARDLDNNQSTGRFDWVAKKGSKVYAFNYITKGENHVGMFNLTPVLYVLEMGNITSVNITNAVEIAVNATK